MRIRSALSVAFRLVALMASFQLAGFGHIAGDLVEILTIGHHHDTSDEDEGLPDHECPPGCPTCHHVHLGGATLPPKIAASVAGVPLCEATPLLTLADDDAPRGPPRPSVYRPPRS